LKRDIRHGEDQAGATSDYNDIIHSQNEGSVECIEKTPRDLVSVGSMIKSKRNVDGRNFFEGHLCHVSIYTRALSADDISRHVHSANNVTRIADLNRYYALSDSAFQKAIRRDPFNPQIVREYINHMCTNLGVTNVLYLDPNDQLKRAKRIVDELTRLQNCDGMAEALTIFPNFEGCASLVCQLYSAYHEIK